MMDLTIYAAAVSSILLGVLIWMYARIYRDTKTRFSLGLVLFAALLLSQNLLTVYSLFTMGNLVADPMPVFLLAINVGQALGVLVLLQTTRQ